MSTSPPTPMKISREPPWKQMTLLASVFAKSVTCEKRPTWEEIMTAVIKHIAKDTAPVSVVEQPGLKSLNKTQSVWFGWLHIFFAEKVPY